MAYTLIDLMDKLIAIEIILHQTYRDLGDKENLDIKIKTLAKVFAREEEKHIKTYNLLKDRLNNEKNIDIDFELYDKASKVVKEFKDQIFTPEARGVKQLIESMIIIEKRNVAMIVRIRDIIIKNLEQRDTIVYKVLDELLNEEENHVINLEQILKR